MEAASPRQHIQPSAAGRPSSSKDLRRAKAALREKHLPAIRKLRDRVAALENEITALETRERDLAAQLAAPPENFDYAAASKSLRAAQHQLHVLALEWEERSTALAALEKTIPNTPTSIFIAITAAMKLTIPIAAPMNAAISAE